MRRVPETLSDEILTKMHALESKKQLDAEVPVMQDANEVRAWCSYDHRVHRFFPATNDLKLANYDCIIFGTPTRFGMHAYIAHLISSCPKLILCSLPN